MRFRVPSGASLALLALLPAATSAQQPDTARWSELEARSIGPAVMSGRIAAVEGLASTPDTLFVGAATGGVWKTVNGGTTWTPVFDDQPTLSIGDIEVHPRNHDLVWVGTGEDNPRNSVGVGRGVFKSVDGGETWTRVGLENTEHIQEIVLHPDDPKVVYVAASGPLWSDGGQRGVYRTTDGGRTWELVLEPPNDRTGAGELVMDPDNPDKLLASLWQRRRWPYFFKSGGPGSGVYISHDGGDSWEQVTAEDGFKEGPLGKIGLAIAPSNPEVVYALAEAEQSALLRSDDGGESWRVVNDSEGIHYRPFYYGRLEVDPSNPDRVYIVAGDLRVSDDGGDSFRNLTEDKGVHVDHHALWIHPRDGSYLVDGNDGGVYISRDRGKTWRFVKNLPLAQFYELSVDERTPYHVYGGLQDNGSWRGPSESWRGDGIRNYQWEKVGFGDGFSTIADPDDPRYGWSTWQEGNLLRFDLKTGDVRPIKPAPPSDTTELRYNWNAPVVVSPHDPNTVYHGAQYVYRSTDDGITWERISADLTTDSAAWQQQKWSGGLTYDVTGAENYTSIYTLAPSPVREGVIWAGTDDGNVQVTRDGGETWTNVEDEMPGKPRHAWVSHIEASKHAAGSAYAVIHDYMHGDWTPYVYRTDDFGQSWRRLPTRRVDGFARTLEEDPVNPDLLWLGTEFGLFWSRDGGQSWGEWTQGFPGGVPVRAVTTQPEEHDVVVGTHGRGVYVIDDIRPLRAVTRDRSVLDAGLHLFNPGAVLQHVEAPPTTYREPGSTMYEGDDEPYGVTLTVAASVSDTLAGEQAEADETQEAAARPDTVRYPYTQVEAAPDTAPRKPPAREAVFRVLEDGSPIRRDTVQLQDGLNRHTWNLSGPRFRGEPRSKEELEKALDEPPEERELTWEDGPQVVPGRYTVRFVTGGDTASGTLEVRGDPRTNISQGDRRAKRKMLLRIGRLQDTGTRAVEALRTTRIRVERVLTVLSEQDVTGAEGLSEQGRALLDSLEAAEEEWVGPVDPEPQGITEFETVMNAVGELGYQVSEWHAPTPSERRRVEQAAADVRRALDRTNRILTRQAVDFRLNLVEAGLPPLAVPGRIAPPTGG